MIGAGSPYVPIIIDSLISNYRINVREIVLIAPTNNHISVIKDFCQELIKLRGCHVNIVLSNDIDNTISDSDLIMLMFRSGGLYARIQEEKLAKEFQIIGQESQGIGGFASALRNIEALKPIAERINKYAPHSRVINLTNPAGIMTKASIEFGLNAIGFCDAPYNVSKSIADFVGIKRDELDFRYIGLNHLGWFTDILYKDKSILSEILGSERLPQLIKALSLPGISPPKFLAEMMCAIKAIPTTYVLYYYQPEDIRLTLEGNTFSRGEQVTRVNEMIFDKFRQKEMDTWPQYLYSSRSGYLLGEAISSFIEDWFYNSASRSHIICLQNHGIVDGINVANVVETTVKVVDGNFLPFENNISISGQLKSLITTVSEYERLTVEAAISGSREKALHALAIHPHIKSIDKASQLLERILVEFKGALPPII